MLSDEEKREMLEDAQSETRRKSFAQARQRSLTPMTGEEYIQFLQSVQNMFPQVSVPKPTLGTSFKL